MGIISKIEDKLSSSKSSSTEQQTYDSSTTPGASKLQNPISSQQGSGPTGTAVSGVGRDEYGTSNSSSGYSSSLNPSSHTTQTSSGVNPNTTTSTNTTTTSTGERQFYDPYSRKGQQTAHSAAISQGMAPSTSAAYEDPNVARGQQGGVLNSSHGHYSSAQQPGVVSSSGTRQPHTVPPSTTQQPGTSSISSQPQTTSSHHYGRDAAVIGGTGAAGVGAYEMGKHSGPTSSSQYPPGTATTSQPGHSQVQPSSGGLNSSSAAAGSASANMSQSQKMGAAYEAGYRDAMEHVKADMMNKLNEP